MPSKEIIINSRLTSKITIPVLPLSFRRVSKIQRGKEIIPRDMQITKYKLFQKILNNILIV